MVAAAGMITGGAESTGKAVGTALLGVAKELPWVGPLAAVMVGAMYAAQGVQALKEDATLFVKNVQSIENILLDISKKGGLPSVQPTCDALKDVIEAGVAHCHRLSQRVYIMQMLLVGRDGASFKQINENMHRQISVIGTGAGVEVVGIVLDGFNQERALTEKIESLGGSEAVANDPGKFEECKHLLNASGKLSSALHTKTHRKLDKIVENVEENSKEVEALRQQVAELTGVVAAFIKEPTVNEVEKSWATVETMGAETVGVLLFRQIFDIAPEALQLFSFKDEPDLFESEKLKKHGAAVVRTCGKAVSGLRDVQTLAPVLKALGEKHKTYGVIPAHYDVVGEALMRTLSLGLGDAFTPKIRCAWLDVYACIAITMQGNLYEEDESDLYAML